MNILDEIVSKKRTRVGEAKSIVSIEDIQNQLAKSSSLKSNFKKNLENFCIGHILKESSKILPEFFQLDMVQTNAHNF